MFAAAPLISRVLLLTKLPPTNAMLLTKPLPKIRTSNPLLGVQLRPAWQVPVIELMTGIGLKIVNCTVLLRWPSQKFGPGLRTWIARTPGLENGEKPPVFCVTCTVKVELFMKVGVIVLPGGWPPENPHRIFAVWSKLLPVTVKVKLPSPIVADDRLSELITGATGAAQSVLAVPTTVFESRLPTEFFARTT